MEGLKAEIDSLNAKWKEFLKAKDVDGLAGMYAEDCTSMTPNSPVLHGREAMKNVYKSFFDAGATDGNIVSEEVGPSGHDHVFMRGTYDVFKAGGEVMEKGKVVMIYKRVDGHLQIYIDIDNTF